MQTLQFLFSTVKYFSCTCHLYRSLFKINCKYLCKLKNIFFIKLYFYLLLFFFTRMSTKTSVQKLSQGSGRSHAISTPNQSFRGNIASPTCSVISSISNSTYYSNNIQEETSKSESTSGVNNSRSEATSVDLSYFTFSGFGKYYSFLFIFVLPFQFYLSVWHKT